MCLDPVSLGVMAVSAAVGAGGSIFSGASQASTHSSNAAALRQQAADRQAKAQYDSELALRKYVRTSGSRDAMIGTTGLSANSFSDIFADDKAESALEIEAIKYQGKLEARNLEFQAAGQDRLSKDARISSYFNAASSVVNSVSSIYKAKTQFARAGITPYSPFE